MLRQDLNKNALCVSHSGGYVFYWPWNFWHHYQAGMV